MKFNRITAIFTICIVILQSVIAYAYDTSKETIREKQFEFASQYEYSEGDCEKSFDLYPGIIYTSGIEETEDGTIFECPAIYIDEHAAFYNSYNLKKGEAKFIINGNESRYTNECILYNSRLLIPVDSFKEVGCEVNFDENSYVTTISKNNVVLEVLPNLIGMRKNRADGFYVPLEVCARFVDDELYVPVRAIATELNLIVGWNDNTYTVTLDTVN